MANHTPGPWSVEGRANAIMADNVEKGPMKVADIRGWGYLTGKGHGALGLPDEEAVAIQEANGRLLAAAPDMLAALKNLVGEWHEGQGMMLGDRIKQARAAIDRAQGAAVTNGNRTEGE